MRFFRHWTLMLLPLLMSGCDSRNNSAYLLIAIDGLPSDKVNCVREEIYTVRSGIQILCKESVRFTNAFTSSTMTVPALSSLLTGKYPLEHGVRHNGAPGLKQQEFTVIEAAYQRGFETLFISGGPPVISRSGLFQGVIHSHDQMDLDRGPFIPLEDNISILMNHLMKLKNNFFAVLHIRDLLFSDPIDEESAELELSFDSARSRVDESLFMLFQFMKKEGIWNKSTVILVGLQGQARSERDIPAALALEAEMTKIPMFIKPAEKSRDESMAWQSDRLVSLADVGKTLLSQFGYRIAEDDLFPTLDLNPILNNHDLDAIWDNRRLLVESGWLLWQNGTAIRHALILDDIFLINDSQPIAYQYRSDALMTNPSTKLHERHISEITLLKEKGIDPFSESSIHKYPAPPSMTLWKKKNQVDLLKALRNLAKEGSPAAHWLAMESLDIGDLQNLKAAGKAIKDKSKMIDDFVSLSKGLQNPSDLKDSCWRDWIQSQEETSCPQDQRELNQLWRAANSGSQGARLRLAHLLESRRKKLKSLRINLQLGCTLMPCLNDWYSPDYFDLLAALPANAKLRSQLKPEKQTDLME
ncbi:MAG: sulfatase-like hydrolase/transferase [Bdellovibrionaceae bacterium]|nr:sulfatase-like hydrolase/transferase [Pseudobdellovibrionaceae bacterium]